MITIFSLLQKCNFSMNQGRTIATLLFVGVDNIVAGVLNILLLLWTSSGFKNYIKNPIINFDSAAKSAVLLWNIYRSWMYSIAPIYIKSNFPAEYFGRLLGIMRITFGTCFLVRVRKLVLFDRIGSFLFSNPSWAVIGLAQIPNSYPELGFKAVSGNLS